METRTQGETSPGRGEEEIYSRYGIVAARGQRVTVSKTPKCQPAAFGSAVSINRLVPIG